MEEVNIWILINTIGGLGIMLYGMVLMNENIVQSAGKRLRNLLLTLTENKIKGFLTGLGITCLVQSSSATTVMETGLVAAGLMTFHQSLAVTLGAELGSTVTGQLVAFKITKYSLIICAIGFFISLIAKTKNTRNIAYSILGFGILFLGLDLMSKALSPLRSHPLFIETMKKVESPIIGILVGLIFTMVVQSSAVTSGIVVMMAMAGSITLEQAIPLNLGASIGTSITAFLASLTLNREAKRVAYSHTSRYTGIYINLYTF